MLKSLAKALDVIELLATERRPLPLAVISRRLNMSKPTLHEILLTLSARGFVQRLSGANYQLGLRAWEVGAAASVEPLVSASETAMQHIATSINEDAALSVLSGFEIVNVHVVSCGQAVRVYAPIGTRIPAHHAAAGLLLLAHQPEEYIESVMPATLAPATALTISNPARLKLELKRIRERGYAINMGGWQLDVAGAAAPIVNADGMAIAALCVAAPRYRTNREWMRRTTTILVEGAATISNVLSTMQQPRERLAS
jgi:DNA-binding IclR family transcriptional regulator